MEGVHAHWTSLFVEQDHQRGKDLRLSSPSLCAGPVPDIAAVIRKGVVFLSIAHLTSSPYGDPPAHRGEAHCIPYTPGACTPYHASSYGGCRGAHPYAH